MEPVKTVTDCLCTFAIALYISRYINSSFLVGQMIANNYVSLLWFLRNSDTCRIVYLLSSFYINPCSRFPATKKLQRLKHLLFINFPTVLPTLPYSSTAYQKDPIMRYF